jgi:hypothetical protein
MTAAGEPGAELMEAYAGWLAEHRILCDAGAWTTATTDGFLERGQE